MARVVLDASAILAMLRAEPGADEVAEVIGEALVSVVNEAEVIGKLIWRGQSPEQSVALVRQLPYRLADLDAQLSRRAGAWWGVTRAHGLSVADRCCLALAERERLPAMTTDRSWTKVDLGVEVRLVSRRVR